MCACHIVVFYSYFSTLERLPNPIEDELFEKFKKILEKWRNGEKCGENDIKASKKINRVLLSKKYKVILKKIPLTGKEERSYSKY